MPGLKQMKSDTAYAFDVFLLLCLWGKVYICQRLNIFRNVIGSFAGKYFKWATYVLH